MRYFLFFAFTGISISLFGQSTQAALQAILDEYELTGLQVSYQEGAQQELYTLGNARLTPQIPVSDTTLFEAASLTKVVVAYTALRLLDKGLLQLDAPLIYYVETNRLSEIAAPERITPRMVLTHTSGFPNWTMNASDPDWPLSKLYVRFPPGSSWSYSGEGFCLLQQALEAISGKSLEQLVAEEVFQPLGMRNSGLVWQEKWQDRMALGHNREGKESELRTVERANAAYSMVTTAADYQRFLQALLRGDGLQSGTSTAMQTAQVPAIPRGRADDPAMEYIFWGLGVGVQKDAEGTALWHWGDNGVFKGFFIAFPEEGKSLVFFSNHHAGLRAGKDLFNLFFPDKAPRALDWVFAW